MPIVLYSEGIKGDKIISKEFINAYIGDIDRPELDNQVLLVWDDGVEETYPVPEEFEEDYWKIINSQYSKTSKEYKKLVLEFWGEDYASEFFRLLSGTDTISSKMEMQKGVVRSKLKELIADFDVFKEIYNMGVLA
jgi:hypothetical protein